MDAAYGQVLQFTHHNEQVGCALPPPPAAAALFGAMCHADCQFEWEAHVMQCKEAVEQVRGDDSASTNRHESNTTHSQ